MSGVYSNNPPPNPLPKGGGVRVKCLSKGGRRRFKYAELHCLSNFSFLKAASHPEELVQQAAELGYEALAITDECSLAGIVRAHEAAKANSLKLIVGAEFHLDDGCHVVALAPTRIAYNELCALITEARRAAPKGEYHISFDDCAQRLKNALLLWVPSDYLDEKTNHQVINQLQQAFINRWWLAVELIADGNDAEKLACCQQLAKENNFRLVASTGALMHVRQRRVLHDVLTAIRLNTPIDQLGFALQSNGERHLRPLSELQQWYPSDLLAETSAIAERCHFSLDELCYEYPQELVPDDKTPSQHLRELVFAGAKQRWPSGMPDHVYALIERELKLIAELDYEEYFLTVDDIVRFARQRNILCQGRGSAANSAVCFALGITEVDPAHMSLLFERFISKERNEPPDIDVDFEHQRREEVIQYIYDKYSRERAALAATVICYRSRSAVRDVGKALGVDSVQADRLAKQLRWRDGPKGQGAFSDDRIRQIGLDPKSILVRRWLKISDLLCGFPRHLSQHVGGFVIARRSLKELVPVENAAMTDRTVIQWDKDDLEALGLLKVDVLGLGMLSVLRRSFGMIKQYSGRKLTMATVPAEDQATYDMINKGDTVGVFQIESRAQMAMLPRLKPRCFYDLVIEVAIVRPGPIQGDMVHPYLRRRAGEEAVTYPSEAVKKVLERTLGVPIFQEQAMQLAMVAAGFTPGEADQLRRAMAAWKRKGGLDVFRDRLVNGMLARGYDLEFAERVYKQIHGFADYGFPESLAASFALIAYVSAWLKCHEPAAFFAAMINSQPMGFYGPSQLIQQAKRQHVKVRPVDVCNSDYECTLEPDFPRTLGENAQLYFSFPLPAGGG
ncbi:MAG: error-prone DNA polymerase, partial [Gammaproteobacteria bacterium]|nr:error-prone DNA polymerase [Gammaproteobacteria bacterium]